ncbi:MAG: glycosyl hydrolase, partial [Candidatus Binatia bacterium]
PLIRARTAARVVGAASLPINTSFPEHLDFNRRMVELGILDFIDIYNIHWYSVQLERLLLGIEDFLDGIPKPIWCTESGIQGSTRQLGFAEEVFPALDDHLDRLERIYIFTYFDNQPPASTFGLVANDGTESDLYQFLRDG